MPPTPASPLPPPRIRGERAFEEEEEKERKRKRKRK